MLLVDLDGCSMHACRLHDLAFKTCRMAGTMARTCCREVGRTEVGAATILSLAVYFVNGSKKAVPEPENCEAVGTMPTEVVETAYALLELEIRYDTHYIFARSDARFALKLCVF